MSVRAFYHNSPQGEISLPQDARPVPPERLQALGWQFSMLNGDDIVKQATEIAQKYGQTKVTDVIRLPVSEPLQNVQTVEEKVIKMVKDQESKEYYAAGIDRTFLCIDGQAHYDIEDPFEKMWIRVNFTKGLLVYGPGGSHVRLTFGDSESLDVLVWLKDLPPSEINWVMEKGTENHPARLRYLKSLGIEN
ncbi:hypothetical protein BT96DRAFT_1017663 [Gymnopus androsaceus JB14]|uniref:Uncharacterized protein n=1 Tax=Gymnopus androsaceus JB14 TaxID=1447944 RepID=A0A6A4HZ12_9AGAR|nr:hypothetical protein BT96DRAFT_1017663 [Gymnopus androsaceus JB14]